MTMISDRVPLGDAVRSFSDSRSQKIAATGLTGNLCMHRMKRGKRRYKREEERRSQEGTDRKGET